MTDVATAEAPELFEGATVNEAAHAAAAAIAQQREAGSLSVESKAEEAPSALRIEYSDADALARWGLFLQRCGGPGGASFSGALSFKPRESRQDFEKR
jgi:hypothetical protein